MDMIISNLLETNCNLLKLGVQVFNFNKPKYEI